jgi:hypothetical protein
MTPSRIEPATFRLSAAQYLNLLRHRLPLFLHHRIRFTIDREFILVFEWEIPRVGGELHADGLTDMAKETVAFLT